MSFLYLAGTIDDAGWGGQGAVFQYGVTADGTLTPSPLSSVLAGAYPSFITVVPAPGGGSAAYVVNNGDNSISQYTVDGTGALTAMAPSSVPTGLGPDYGALTASGQALFVTNQADNTVSTFFIGSGGALTPAPAATPTGNSPEGLSVVGSYLYVVNEYDGTASEFAIADDGGLTPLVPDSVTLTYGTPLFAAASPNGQNVYISSGTAQYLMQYGVNAGTGQLEALSPPVVDAGNTAFGVSVSPTGQYVATVNLDSTAWLYSVGAGGTLSFQALASAGTFPSFGTFDVSGQYFYVANGDNSVSQFTVVDGGLVPLNPPTVSTGPLYTTFPTASSL